MTRSTNSDIAEKNIPCRTENVTQWIWAMTLVVSVIIVFTNGWRAQQVLSSASWPVTSGTIIASDLNYTPLSRTANKYHLEFIYRYALNGIQYESRQISYAAKTSFVGRTSSERYVKQVLEKYPAAATVSVHYHPSNPGRAVLDTQLPNRIIKLLLLGLAMMLLSLTGFWRRWSLQTDYLFRPYDPDAPMTANKFILGALGLAVCLGIVWIWWELIKLYSGR